MRLNLPLAAVLGIALMEGACLAEPTVGKPTNVELTIYNQDFGLVKEERQMTLDKGINMVPVQGVAATIDATSVAFKSKSDPNAVVVREQNYRYDLISPNTILSKSVGKRVKIRRFVDGAVKEDDGVLLSTPENGTVVRTDHGLILNPSGEIEVAELPEGLLSRPTLVWKLESTKAGPQTTEISYIANSMSWTADYVAVIDPLDKYIDLTGWVTLTNNSGATYGNAVLNLVAGDVHRVQQDRETRLTLGAAPMMAKTAAPQFTEKQFFEYHLYTLQGRTTVANRETKQITLLTANHVPAKKLFVYDPRSGWWNQWRYASYYRPGDSYDVSANKKAAVYIEIVNSKQNNLGMPLPKGRIRMYKSEPDTNQHFIGEDSIDHTPKDEKIRLYMGDAFDLVGEHTRTGFRKISNREVEESFEVSLRNHKGAPVAITLVDHFFGDWRITASSVKHTKKDASTAEFPVEIPKDGETKVTYTVRTRW